MPPVAGVNDDEYGEFATPGARLGTKVIVASLTTSDNVLLEASLVTVSVAVMVTLEVPTAPGAPTMPAPLNDRPTGRPVTARVTGSPFGAVAVTV